MRFFVALLLCCTQAFRFEHKGFPGNEPVVYELARTFGVVDAEQAAVRLLEGLERDARVKVIDVGANIGTWSVAVAKLGHHVYAFEPFPESCERIRKAAASNAVTSLIDVRCVAVSDNNGTASLDVSVAASASFSIQSTAKALGGAKVIQVPIVRLDDEIAPHESVYIMKTDTQGLELSVLQGAVRLLRTRQVKYLIVEFSFGLLSSHGTNPMHLLQFIYNFGFVCTFLQFKAIDKTTRCGKGPCSFVYPGFAKDRAGPAGVTFAELIDKVQNVGGERKPGWTDLLCF